jgi:hypothetical protein
MRAAAYLLSILLAVFAGAAAVAKGWPAGTINYLDRRGDTARKPVRSAALRIADGGDEYVISPAPVGLN